MALSTINTGSLAALEILWIWAKEAEMNAYELKNKLLLPQAWGYGLASGST